LVLLRERDRLRERDVALELLEVGREPLRLEGLELRLGEVALAGHGLRDLDAERLLELVRLLPDVVEVLPGDRLELAVRRRHALPVPGRGEDAVEQVPDVARE